MCLISPGEKKQEELHHTNALFRSPTTPKNNKLLNYDYTQYISVPPFPLSLLRASTWGIPTVQLYENRDGDPASVLLPLFLWLQTILAPHHLDWTERIWAPCLFSANSSLNLWCMMWNPLFLGCLKDGAAVNWRQNQQPLSSGPFHQKGNLWGFFEFMPCNRVPWHLSEDVHGVSPFFLIEQPFWQWQLFTAKWLGQNTSCNSWAMHTRIRGKGPYLDIKRVSLSVDL